MADKRRDSKGRVLRTGENQRADGMYMYRYIDVNGDRKCLYSWRLVKTDKIPPGKKYCEPLRDMIDNVKKDLTDGIDSHKAATTTLNEFYEEYINLKYELKESSRANYKYMWKKFVYDTLGNKEIGALKYSDIKKFYILLIKDRGFKPNSIETIQCLLHPVLATAVRDGYIRSNPSDGVLADIKKSHEWEKPKRHALTIPQQKRFINFVANSKTFQHWLPLFTVLLGTGGRIGEVLGLRWEDCDFENNIISINHNLIYRPQEDGRTIRRITTPKTKSGVRIIPMFSEVKEALSSLPKNTTNVEIDGYSNFIFSNRFGDVLTAHDVNRAIERVIEAANKEEGDFEKLPHFSAHNLRHTFCTRLCENETNLKIIQEIMGHRNIETTMDVYNEATKEKKLETFSRLEGKMVITPN